jgi:glycerate kinase
VLSWAQSSDSVVVSVTSATTSDHALPLSSSSVRLGEAVRYVLEQRARPPATILLDCAAVDTHDGGAGLLAGLGATADVPLTQGVSGLRGLGELDLASVRDLIGDRLVGVVPAGQLSLPLLGLRGITSLRGRTAGLDPEELLATDAALERLAEVVNRAAGDIPGAGACGGVGFAVLALGGSLTSGPAVGLGSPEATAAIAGADLVVTGCTLLDFASRGGGVVAEAAQAAAAALCPCIAVAGEVVIGGRELRTLGIESAYPVGQSTLDRPVGGDVAPAELAKVAARVGRSWRW